MYRQLAQCSALKANSICTCACYEKKLCSLRCPSEAGHVTDILGLGRPRQVWIVQKLKRCVGFHRPPAFSGRTCRTDEIGRAVKMPSIGESVSQ